MSTTNSRVKIHDLIIKACVERRCTESELANGLGLSKSALRAFKTRPAPRYLALALMAVIGGLDVDPLSADVEKTRSEFPSGEMAGE